MKASAAGDRDHLAVISAEIIISVRPIVMEPALEAVARASLGVGDHVGASSGKKACR